MLRTISLYGVIAGLIVGAEMIAMMYLVTGELPSPYGYIVGYTTMLIALSAVFVGIKRRRDIDLGGVIGFWPALGLGLGISFVASVIYALAWELSLAMTHVDFMAGYTKMVVAQAKAKGASPAALAKLTADMQQLRIQYANPLHRIPETFTEIFPVGVLVSVVSAGLLCNRRFLPARRSS
jgi:Protein of unknown function (DUF4199)